MTLPESNQNKPSKLKKLLNGGEEESPITRLPRGAGSSTPDKTISNPRVEKQHPSGATIAKTTSDGNFNRENYSFLPAFWTVASILSFTVNIVLVIILLVVLQNFKSIGITVNDLSSHLLGGLYTNFVRMDEAHITTNIPVSQEIPVQFTLNVSGATNVTLSENVTIDGALVTVNTGGLNINNARAQIILPQGTILPIFIQNLAVPVDQKVLAELNVAVDIPLDQTDLHEPFVGLQNVVQPYYCLLEPLAQFNGVEVCP